MQRVCTNGWCAGNPSLIKSRLSSSLSEKTDDTAPEDLFGVGPVEQILPHVAVERHRRHNNDWRRLTEQEESLLRGLQLATLQGESEI